MTYDKPIDGVSGVHYVVPVTFGDVIVLWVEITTRTRKGYVSGMIYHKLNLKDAKLYSTHFSSAFDVSDLKDVLLTYGLRDIDCVLKDFKHAINNITVLMENAVLSNNLNFSFYNPVKHDLTFSKREHSVKIKFES